MVTISPPTLRFLRSIVRNQPSPSRRATRCLTTPSRAALQPASPERLSHIRGNRRNYFPTTSKAAPGQRRATAVPEEAAPPPQAQVPQTYYELFPTALPDGPPPTGPFSVNLRTLRGEFLKLQAKAHPDLHSGENKRRAEATSALINEAYKTLQDPLRRAQYLLSLRGIETDKDEAAKLGGDPAGGDSELLMTVMEVNEIVEEAEAQEQIDELKSENDERVTESVAALEGLFEEEDLEGARREAIRLRYWTNIKQSLDEWEPGKPTVLVH